MFVTATEKNCFGCGFFVPSCQHISVVPACSTSYNNHFSCACPGYGLGAPFCFYVQEYLTIVWVV